MLFDLLVPKGGDATFDRAWDIARDVILQGGPLSVLCLCGTRRDLVPPDALGIATYLYRHERDLERIQPGLKLLPVSSVSGFGCDELARHVGV